MPIKILMPALSPTMTEGTLASWQVKEGDTVEPGDVLAEIETDKATMEVEAVDEGTVGKILVDAGTDGVAVNDVIALLLEDGEDASALDGADTSSGGSAPKADEPEQKAEETTDEAKAEPAPANQNAAPADSGSGDRVFASPLARRMAKKAGLDLGNVKGSGPRGRIVKADIEAAMAGGGAAKSAEAEARPATQSAQPAATAAMPAGPDARQLADAFGMKYEEVKASNMRKTIAKRLTEAKQTVPHFYLTVDCEIDGLLASRKQLNELTETKISVNDIVIAAVAKALKEVPAANASWAGDATLMYEHADISVAVATPEGLITPIIKAAETKGLATISGEMKDLAGRAREGKLKPEEYQGGTFSVSNLGMFGIREFAAIINPPQGCILAVGAGEQRPVIRDGEMVARTIMTCTLSVDHRVVDGAVGAEFMAAFKRLVENPMRLLL